MVVDKLKRELKKGDIIVRVYENSVGDPCVVTEFIETDNNVVVKALNTSGRKITIQNSKNYILLSDRGVDIKID